MARTAAGLARARRPARCAARAAGPGHTRDDARLDYFLGCVPSWMRVAVEFRHDSWIDDAVFAILERARRGVLRDERRRAAVRAAGDGAVRLRPPPRPRPRTTSTAGPTPTTTCAGGPSACASGTRPGLDVYAYFNNDGGGQRRAQRLQPVPFPSRGLLGDRSGRWTCRFRRSALRRCRRGHGAPVRRRPARAADERGHGSRR